jgi:hypothetical protein
MTVSAAPDIGSAVGMAPDIKKSNRAALRASSEDLPIEETNVSFVLSRR